MTNLTAYKPWEDDSQHDAYDTANARREALFEEKIEGLQVKVKRTSEGRFLVKTRVPIPPKPTPKKKVPAKKTTRSTSKKTATKPKVTAASTKTESSSASPKTTATKKRTTRKTSRKRK